jgi:hypothetical protein
MLAVHGFFENGTVRINDPVPDYEKCDVIVTFLPAAYNAGQITRNDDFLLLNPRLRTANEKNDAIDGLLGICEDNTMTIDDIKNRRLKRQ